MIRKFYQILLYVLIRLHNYLYHKISRVSTILNNEIHPKHRIMNYHQFFVNNIDENSRVLDIGCGNGFLSYDIAKKAQKVIAIDRDQKAILIANKRFSKNNLEFIVGDATKYDFNEDFDYIILSNVLEHIKNRQSFLKRIKQFSKTILIRVPMLDRSWLTIFKKELKYEYRLDPNHYIEYTIVTFKKEIESVGLKIYSYSIQFGEIWAKVGF